MRNLTDNDRRLGPITYGKTERGTFSLIWSSANPDLEDEQSTLTLRLLGWVFMVRVPDIIKPLKVRVSGITTDGITTSNWYWAYRSREYGFIFVEDFLQLFHGVQRYDGVTSDRSYYFLPWKQNRFIRHSLYDDYGEIYYEYSESNAYTTSKVYEERHACPSVYFLLEDLDGNRILAKTVLEEREWRKGDGLFKWVSWFSKPIIQTYLCIEYTNHVQYNNKLSPGNYISQTVDIIPGETRDQTVRRYCLNEYDSRTNQYRIKYIKRVSEPYALFNSYQYFNAIR